MKINEANGMGSLGCKNKAEELERILIKGTKTNDSSIINFLKENVYPTYREYVKMAIGDGDINNQKFYEEDSEVKKHYGGKN